MIRPFVFRAVLAAVVLASSVLPAQQASPRIPDSTRARIDRMSNVLQGADVANDPQLADAINEILSDTSAHMRMAPTRAATPADSARAASIVALARTTLAK